MPALEPTDFYGEIVWLGVLTDMQRKAMLGENRDALDLRFDGVEGSVHGGLTRPSCSRVKAQYPRGTEIRNERQVSILSLEELQAIARDMGLDQIDPARLGATMVLRGIPDFTHVPPSSRLQAPSGATLTVDMENLPCQFPAKSIDSVAPGLGKGFKPAAKGRRGVTAWVAAEGRVVIGDKLRLHLPMQRPWAPQG